MADVADALYQVFDPARPLAANETALYVDWQNEVGIEDVKNTLPQRCTSGRSPGAAISATDWTRPTP